MCKFFYVCWKIIFIIDIFDTLGIVIGVDDRVMNKIMFMVFKMFVFISKFLVIIIKLRSEWGFMGFGLKVYRRDV